MPHSKNAHLTSWADDSTQQAVLSVTVIQTAAPPPSGTPVSWALNANGDWSTAKDWSTKKLPTSTNNVTLSTASDITVTHSTGTDTVYSIISTTDLLSITGGSLTVRTTGSLGGGLSLTGGVLALAGDVSVTGNFTATAATVLLTTGASVLSIAGAGTLGDAAGDMLTAAGPGTLSIDGTTTLEQGSGPGLLLGQGAALTVNGTFNDLGQIAFNSVAADTAQIRNNGTFNLASAGNAFTFANTGTDSFTNTGTLADTSGTGTVTFGLEFDNTLSGVIDVAAGTLEATAGGIVSGTVTGAGTLGLGGGTYTSAGIAGTGTIAVNSAATLNFTGVSDSFAGSLAIAGGTLGIGAGTTLALSGGLSLGDSAGDTATLAGPGTLTTAGATAINGAGTANALLLGGGLAWTNTGMVSAAGEVALNLTAGDSVSIINAAGAAFDLTTNSADLTQAFTGTDNFLNAGTLAKTGGGGTSLLQMNLQNTGTVLADAGVLSISGTVSNLAAGTLTGGNWGAYATSGGATISLTASTAITTDAANITLSGSAANLLAGGTALEQSLTTIAASGTLNILAGRGYNTSLSLSDSGLITFGGGVFAAAGLTVAAGASFTGFGTLSAALANAGQVTASGGTLALDGALSGTGTYSAAAGATLDLQAGGALTETINGAGTLQLDGAYTLSTGAITAGTLLIDTNATLNGPGTLTETVIDNGVLSVASGTLAVTGAISGTGSIAVGAGATLAFSGGGNLNTAITNGGTILATGGTLTLNTEVSGGVLSAKAGATLVMDEGGSFSGTLAGAAGTLDIAAAITFGNGIALDGGHMVDTANITLGSSTALVENGGASLSMDAAAGTTISLSGPAPASFVNDGTLLGAGAGTADIASPFTNNGTVSVTSGTLSFLGAMVNNGLIDAASGLLSIARPMTGTGSLEIGATGTLCVLNGDAATQALDFLAGTGVLELADATNFKGTISGFGASDKIDLLSAPETSATFSAGILRVYSGTTLEASLHFASGYTLADFAFSSDNNGGTAITFK